MGCPRCASLLNVDWYGDPHCPTCGYVDYFYRPRPPAGFPGPLGATTYYLRYRGKEAAFRDVLTVAIGDKKALGKPWDALGYVATCPFCSSGMGFRLGVDGQTPPFEKGWRCLECPSNHRVWIDFKKGAPAAWR